MQDYRSKAIQYAKKNQDRFLEELSTFAAIPSISTDPKHEKDMVRTAEWIAEQLHTLEMDNVNIFPTQGHPIVYAENTLAGPNKPTVLIYGHYDVQPPDPLNEWETDPFHPTVRGEHLYARGATDMKGQVMAGFKAIESIVRTHNLPINVKWIIEGEEEIGSPNIAQFLSDQADLLACDFALNPDTGMIAEDLPTITYALRGLACFEVRVYGPSQDLHSGLYGGVVHNPAQALCELISGMHDKNGRITLPRFYDDVRALSDEERKGLARLPMDQEYYMRQTGAQVLWGEEEYSPVERTTARPTLEVNGIQSGFTGEGVKTVLPAYAMAKISTRLVPDQDPKNIHQQLIEYMEENSAETIRWDITMQVSSKAAISNRKSSWVKAYQSAAESVWNTKPVFKREGGSVPVVVYFQEILNADSLNIGFSLPNNNMHGPNEKLHLPTWYRGIETLIYFIFNLDERGNN